MQRCTNSLVTRSSIHLQTLDGGFYSRGGKQISQVFTHHDSYLSPLHDRIVFVHLSSNNQAPPHSPHSFAAPLPALCTYTTTLQYTGCTQTNNTLRRLLTNVNDKDKLEDRQGAVYKIKYNAMTARPLTLVKPEEILAHDWLNTNEQQEMVMSTLLNTIYRWSIKSTGTLWHVLGNQWLTLESWFTNLGQTPLNLSQQLPAPYKLFFERLNQNLLRENDWTTNNLTNNKQLFNCDNRQIKMHQWHYESSQPITSRLNWQVTNNIMT